MKVNVSFEELSKLASAFLAENAAKASTVNNYIGERVIFRNAENGQISILFPDRNGARRFVSTVKVDIDPEHCGSVLLSLDSVKLCNFSIPGIGGIGWVLGRYLRRFPFIHGRGGNRFSMDIAELLESHVDLRIEKLVVDANGLGLDAVVMARGLDD